MNRGVCVYCILALSAATIFGRSLDAELLLQPCLVFKQNGSWSDSGSHTSGLYRAKGEVTAAEKISEWLTVAGTLGVDVAEGSFEEMLKEASISLSFDNRFVVTAGQTKTLFGEQNRLSSQKLPVFYRSFSADNQKNDLDVSGYKTGITAEGDLFDRRLSLGIGLYYYNHNSGGGTEFRECFDLPIFRIEGKPVRGLRLSYVLALPAMSAKTLGGATTSKRLGLHEIGLAYKAPRLYEGSAELFFGVDTASSVVVKKLLPTYDDNIAFSIHTLQSIRISVGNTVAVRLTAGGEYANGLNRHNDAYVNRAWYYALTGSATLFCGERFFAQISADERFNEKTNRCHDMRIAALLSYQASFSSSKDKKNEH